MAKRVTKKEAAEMSEEMRKIDDISRRKLAVQAAARAYKKKDQKFSITAFAIQRCCGNPRNLMPLSK